MKIIERLDGNMLVMYERGKHKEIKDFFTKNHNAILLVDPISDLKDSDTIITDLNFLNEFSLKRLWIYGASIRDSIGIYSQVTLEEIDLSKNTGIILDFLKFKSLKVLEYNWHPKTKNLFECSSLVKLKIWNYSSNSKDFSEFLSLNRLQELSLIKSKNTSLMGLDLLPSLKKLTLAYCPNTSFSESFKLNNIECLELVSCKNVVDNFALIFPNLKSLLLTDQGKIQSLKPILDNLPKL